MLEKTKDLEKLKIGYPFLLGTFIKVHCISDYDIVEYANGDNEIRFYPYLKNRDNSISFDTLDRALIYVICAKYEKSTSWNNASGYISKMIGLE